MRRVIQTHHHQLQPPWSPNDVHNLNNNNNNNNYLHQPSSSIPFTTPNFLHLSLFETLILNSTFFKLGLRDSCQLQIILDALATNKQLQASVIKNSTLQAILLASVFSFDFLLPRALGHSTPTHLRYLFDALWLCPISLGSALGSGLLSLRVSTSIHSSSAHSRHTSSPPTTLDAGLAARLASDSHRLLLLANYVLLARLLRLVPVLGRPLSFGYCAIANSYYCFEQRWSTRGMTFAERTVSLESRWAYHGGFGLLITLLSFWHPSPFINLSLFTLCFPILLILASSASVRPRPVDPRRPLAETVGDDGDGVLDPGGRAPSSLFPSRMPVFYPARTLYDLLTTALSPRSSRLRNATRQTASGIAGELEEIEDGETGFDDGRALQSPKIGLLGGLSSIPGHPISNSHMVVNQKFKLS